MAAKRRRLAIGAAATLLALGSPVSTSRAQTAPAAAAGGWLVQTPDGTLYLVLQGQTHPITPVPVGDAAVAALPLGDVLPNGEFWLTPPAADVPAPAAPSQRQAMAGTATAAAVATSRRQPTVVTGPSQARATVTARVVASRVAVQPTATALPQRPWGQS